MGPVCCSCLFVFLRSDINEIVTDLYTSWRRASRNSSIVFYTVFMCFNDTFSVYTVRHKKHTKIFYHNFYNTWPILIEIDMQCLGWISHKVS